MSGINPPIPSSVADDFHTSSTTTAAERPSSALSSTRDAKNGLGKWRRPVGLLLLGLTVFLWTASNFLQSTIFADDTYSKPYLVTYVNTACFTLPLFPILALKSWRHPEDIRQWRDECVEFWRERYGRWKQGGVRGLRYGGGGDVRATGRRRLSMSDSQTLLLGTSFEDERAMEFSMTTLEEKGADAPLTVPEIMLLSMEFAFLWFISNYCIGACLEFTTVASSTIITTTSSIWTLIFGLLFRVERFSVKKAFAVLLSLLGVFLICSVDLLSDNTEHRGDFPSKTPRELAIGDSLAFASAILYGLYAVFMKKRISNESRVNMPIFFGFVGLWNTLLLWPGFFIVHYTGLEPFELPPTRYVTLIVLCNSCASLVSDFFWAYAVLLTSPIVVTVGLSMTIPLSLIGQIVLNSQTAPLLYWVGAIVMVMSFVFVSKAEEEEELVAKREEELAHSARFED